MVLWGPFTTFLHDIGGTTFFNSVGKMPHVFGPKLDKVSEPCMTVLILYHAAF